MSEANAQNNDDQQVAVILEQAAHSCHSGDPSTARALCYEVLKNRPDEHRALYVLAHVALNEQQFQDALECFQKALEHAPDTRSAAATWRGAGLLFYSAGDLDRAEGAMRNAMETDPAMPAYPFELGEWLAQSGRHERAIEAYRSAARLDTRSPEPPYRIGNALVELRRYKDALVFYDKALRLAPHSANAHFNRGTTLQMMGQLDEAHTEYTQALELNPDLDGYYHFSQLHTFSREDPYLTAMQSRTGDDSDATTEARIDAGFGLSNALHQLGDHGDAFAACEQANRLKRSTLDYTIEEHEAQAERIMSFLDQAFIQRYTGQSDSTLAPIFIVGMPRSGSTLLEQMLAAHSKINGGGELFHLSEQIYALGESWGQKIEAGTEETETWLEDLNKAARRYAEQTAEYSRNKQRFTDKMPSNFFYVGLIHLLFPRAQIIHCRRHPLDICLSCYQHLFAGGNEFSYDQAELGRYYGLYDRVMRYWHEVLPGRILDVDYEAVVNDPERELRRVLEYCELEFEPACLEFHTLDRPIKTASSVQVRQPLYSSSVDRSKTYREYLTPLLDTLGELADSHEVSFAKASQV